METDKTMVIIIIIITIVNETWNCIMSESKKPTKCNTLVKGVQPGVE